MTELQEQQRKDHREVVAVRRKSIIAAPEGVNSGMGKSEEEQALEEKVDKKAQQRERERLEALLTRANEALQRRQEAETRRLTEAQLEIGRAHV